MDIQTKFNIGDKVYRTRNGRSNQIEASKPCPYCNNTSDKQFSVFKYQYDKYKCPYSSIKTIEKDGQQYSAKCKNGKIVYSYPQYEVISERIDEIDIVVNQFGEATIEYCLSNNWTDYKEDELYANEDEAKEVALKMNAKFKDILYELIE